MMLRRYHVSEDVEKPQETVADTSEDAEKKKEDKKKTSRKKQGDAQCQRNS